MVSNETSTFLTVSGQASTGPGHHSSDEPSRRKPFYKYFTSIRILIEWYLVFRPQNLLIFRQLFVCEERMRKKKEIRLTSIFSLAQMPNEKCCCLYFEYKQEIFTHIHGQLDCEYEWVDESVIFVELKLNVVLASFWVFCFR